MDHIQQQQAWVTWLYQLRGGGLGGGGGVIWNMGKSQAAGLVTSWEMCIQQQDAAQVHQLA